MPKRVPGFTLYQALKTEISVSSFLLGYIDANYGDIEVVRAELKKAGLDHAASVEAYESGIRGAQVSFEVHRALEKAGAPLEKPRKVKKV